jgi:DNA repair protein RadD
MNLRPYQVSTLERARAARRAGHRRILLASPTGSGKTVLGVAMIQRALSLGDRTLVIAHRKELIDQFWGRLYAEGIVAGVLRGQDERTDPAAPVQVGTIQTLTRRDLPPAQLVVVDEAHHCPSDSFQRIMAAYPQATILGLTATPCRTSGEPLKEHFDALIEGAKYSELIEAGAIVAPIVYAPHCPPDLGRVKVVAGDFNADQLEGAVVKAHVVGDVVRTWLQRAEGRRTVLFAVGIQHSMRLVERFKESGVRAAHLDGTTPEEQREQTLLDLELGKLDLVSNVGVLCEGWDQPSVKCCIMARPTMSLTLHMQTAGRILRPWEGVAPILLDHSGNVDRHGLPHEDREWSLEGTAKRLAPRSEYRVCGGCYAYVESMPCPLCGHTVQREPRRVRETTGELTRVDRKPRTPTGDERRDYFDDQAEMARRKGFRPGYAAAKFKEKFLDWPPWAWSQALKAEHAKDPYWQQRVEKRTKEREWWQDRQKASDDLRASAPEPATADDGYPVEEIDDGIPF